MANGINIEDLKELNEIFKDMGGVAKVDDFTTNFEELSAGTYLAEIEKAEAKNSKNSGKPMVEITVAVENNGKNWVRLMLAGKDLPSTKKAIARTIKQLQTLGMEGSNIEDFTDKLDELVGKKVKLTVQVSKTGFVTKEMELV